MAEPPEFWAFVLSNVVVGVLGGILAGLSLLAYRREPSNRSFVLAAVGFGAITLGALAEASSASAAATGSAAGSS